MAEPETGGVATEGIVVALTLDIAASKGIDKLQAAALKKLGIK